MFKIILLTLATAAAIVVTGLLFFGGHLLPNSSLPESSQNSLPITSPSISNSPSTSPLGEDSGNTLVAGSQNTPRPSPAPSLKVGSYFSPTPSLFSSPTPSLGASIVPSPSGSPSTDDVLPLPVVADTEINISENGAGTIAQYLDVFSAEAKNVSFDFNRFSLITRDEYGMIILPDVLVSMGINAENFSEVQQSLSVYKDFLNAKISFLKTIPVTGDAKEISRSMIATDILTISLIDTALSSDKSIEEISDYYQKYENSIKYYAKSFQRGISVSYPIRDFLRKMATLLPISQTAFAQSVTGLGFGGLITAIQECTCTAGFLLWLSPGYNPAPGVWTFFLSYVTIASPLLFAYHSPIPGAWILGNYLPAPGPCLSAALCVPEGAFIGIIEYAGTSL